MIPGIIVFVAVALLLGLFFMIVRSPHKKKGRAFLAALESTPAAARAVLDASYPVVTKVGPLSVVAHRQRLAGLALVGDCKAIEAEMAPLTGPPQFLAQTRAVGWLGIALAGGVEPTLAAARIQELIATLDTSKPIMRLIAAQISVTGALASAMGGKTIEGADASKYAQALGDGPLTQELSHRAQSRALMGA